MNLFKPLVFYLFFVRWGQDLPISHGTFRSNKAKNLQKNFNCKSVPNSLRDEMKFVWNFEIFEIDS